jgi:hypothetical protein
MKSLLSIVFVLSVFIASANSVNSFNFDGNNGEKESASVTYSGKIVDSMSQEALAGVKISIGNTDITVYTDFEGNFSFQLPKNTDISNVKVSYISYEEKTINLSQASTTSIEINPIF